jgi:outer membrane protein assembly factor BamE
MPPRHIVFFSLLLAGCSLPTLPTLAPYRMDIQQGNVVTQEMISKLKPGMTRSQVRFVLGTPLVVDPFRTNRWDYVYLYEKAGRLVEQRHIAVIFEDDKLVRIEGDVIPASAGATAGGVRIEKPAAAPPAPAQGSQLATGAGAPGTAAGTESAAAAGAPPAAAGAAKPAEEKRGFFGRILERIGF